MSERPFNPSLFLGDEAFVRSIQRKHADLFRAEQTVLDLGCGAGVFLELLRERSVRAAGIDLSAECVESCRRKGLDAREAELLRFLETTDERFDGVFCSHVVEHLAPPAALGMLANCRRVLRPGGRLVVVTPNPRDLDVITEKFWLDVTHVRPYPLALLAKMVEHAGFTVERSGTDPDTAPPIRSRNPFILARNLWKKLRWGDFWGGGDCVVIGRLPT
jgi:2-polyprenyl-3-methyl-5-hydroxy-6-metoxy-1,4-benzoquinol methylase